MYFRVLCSFVVLLACFHGAACNDKDKGNDWWHSIAGYAGFGIISVVVGGIFSLIACCVCGCHEKCRKKNILPGGIYASVYPAWTKNLFPDPRLENQGFLDMSDGFMSLNPFHIVRTSTGKATDGARWSMPMTEGKHVFEIIWRWGERGAMATIGLGTIDAPLSGKNPCPLVGNNSHSYGLDISRRRVVHNNRLGIFCPTDRSLVPDRIFMIVDIDEGTLGFGSEVTYWGPVITNLPIAGEKREGKPLFVMVGTSKNNADIHVFYRGTAGNGSGGVNPFVQVTSVPGGVSSGHPAWTKTLYSDPVLQNYGFQEVSSGFNSISPYHIVRQGIGVGTTLVDGARMSVGMTSGKHVFEVIWRWNARGTNAAVGIGTSQAPLKGNTLNCLVGRNRNSWGLDIVARKLMHNNKPFGVCPADGSYVPDRFFMFVDLDSGILGFGTEFKYWASTIRNLPTGTGQPFYVMVTSGKGQAEIQLFYKGSANEGGGPILPDFSVLPPAYSECYQPPKMDVGPSNAGVINVRENDNNIAGPSYSDNTYSERDPPPPYAYTEPTKAGNNEFMA